MWTLGERSIDNRIKVVVKDYQGEVKVHIRHFLKRANTDHWYPITKGITLNLKEWDRFKDNFEAIDLEVRRLRSKNEQVTPVPPTSAKRNLQSAFGGVDA